MYKYALFCACGRRRAEDGRKTGCRPHIMRRKYLRWLRKKCSVIYALEIIGGKWRLPIIWKLSKQESMRYN